MVLGVDRILFSVIIESRGYVRGMVALFFGFLLFSLCNFTLLSTGSERRSFDMVAVL